MCVYSMVADHYRDKWSEAPWYPYIHNPSPPVISREEFEALRRDVADLKSLLQRAKKYDADNGEPDCEMDEKVALLRKIAELVGVDLSDALPKPLG